MPSRRGNPPPGSNSHKRLCGNKVAKSYAKRRGKIKKKWTQGRGNSLAPGVAPPSITKLEPVEVASGAAAAHGQIDIVNAGGLGNGGQLLLVDDPASGAGELHGAKQFALAQRAIDGD